VEPQARLKNRAGAGRQPIPLADRQHGEANDCAHAYRRAMLEIGFAPVTVNRRLSPLRPSPSSGVPTGLPTWSFAIDGVGTGAYRNTARARLEGVTALKRLAARHKSPAKAARDVAIVRVLVDLVSAAQRGGCA
jgi:hypothetical protein